MIRPTVRPSQRWIWPIHSASRRGQVVVDRDEVDALAGEAVEVDRQRRDEGLALAGLHLGDPAEVQGGAAHQLHVVVALADDPARRPRGRRRRPRSAGRRGPRRCRGAGGTRRSWPAASSSERLRISGSSALMSGTRPARALSFLPSPARRMLVEDAHEAVESTGATVAAGRAGSGRGLAVLSRCRGASRGRRRRPPPSGSAGGASRGCCARGSSPCSRR